MTAATTQPAGALPEPAGQIRLPGAFGLACDGYTADQMRAMMAERDAARERIQHMEAVINDATAEAELAGRREGERLDASIYALRRELEELRAQPAVTWQWRRGPDSPWSECSEADAASGAFESRALYARPIPPDAREGREPLTLEEIGNIGWGAAFVGIDWDTRVAAVRAVERYLGTSADGETQHG